MDSTVIQEIANQLGMAVDQAGQFITEQLPAFAGLKVMQATVPIVICWALFVIPSIVSVVSVIIANKSCKKNNADDSKCRKTLDDFYSFWVFVVSGLIALVMLVIALLVTGFSFTEIVGWSQYPQAMLIDMALNAV